MKKLDLKYIGIPITKDSLEDAVLKFEVTESDTILISQKNLDNLALIYREKYKSSLEIPFKCLGINIEEDLTDQVPVDRIGIIRNGVQEDILPSSVIDHYKMQFFGKA